MPRFLLAATIAIAGLTTPAFAGGFGFDLPRLDFPTPAPTTRACQDITSPATCSVPKR